MIFSYEGIWATENASPANPEYILTRQYMAGNGDYGDFTRYIQMRPDQMNGGWASVEPIQSLVDAYWNVDGETKPATLTPKERADRFKVMVADRNEYETVSESAGFQHNGLPDSLLPLPAYHTITYSN